MSHETRVLLSADVFISLFIVTSDGVRPDLDRARS